MRAITGNCIAQMSTTTTTTRSTLVQLDPSQQPLTAVKFTIFGTCCLHFTLVTPLAFREAGHRRPPSVSNCSQAGRHTCLQSLTTLAWSYWHLLLFVPSRSASEKTEKTGYLYTIIAEKTHTENEGTQAQMITRSSNPIGADQSLLFNGQRQVKERTLLLQLHLPPSDSPLRQAPAIRANW